MSDIDRIVVFGSKASDNVTIDPSVDPAIFVTLDGGHGGGNNLHAAAGSTREHGWFGFNNLFGGTGTNQLIGRKGHVAFHPTATTDEIFAGVIPPPSKSFFHHNAPGGTFFKNVNGRAVPIPTPVPSASGTLKALTLTSLTTSKSKPKTSTTSSRGTSKAAITSGSGKISKATTTPGPGTTFSSGNQGSRLPTTG